MSPSGQATHIGLGKETIWGTPQGASDYIKFSSETLTLAIEELISTSLAVKRDEPDSYEGLGSIAGDSVHEVHPNALGYLLRAWFGKTLSSELIATTAYKHIFTPGKDKEAKGTADSGSETTLVDADLVSVDDEFNGCWVHIIAGTNSGEWRIITDSEAASDTITVSPAFALAIDNTSVYEIRNGPEHCILPPYTLEVHRDLPEKAFQFSGCVPNTLAFSFGVGAKILSLTASWLGKDVALITPTTPSFETTEPFRWNQAILLVGIFDSGTSTNGTLNTTTLLNDTGKAWTVDALIGKYIRMTSGNCQDQIRKITDNDATSVTFAPAMSEAPSTDKYEIWDEDNLLETLTLTLSNGLVPIPLLNNTKRISKIVGDAFRSGTIAPTFHVETRTDWDTYFKGWTTKPWLVLFRGAVLSGAYYSELQFHLPKVLFTAYPLSVAGPGRLTVGATGKIKYDSTAAHKYLAKVVLFNSKQAYA